MNPRQLTFVREYRGYSQTELSSNIKGLSQSNLSKFEKGVGQLSDEVKQRIIDFLGFPKAFYEQSISNNVDNAHYRKKLGLGKKEKEYIERSNKLIGYIIDQMSGSIDFPMFSLRAIDLEEDYTPEYVAQFTRRLIGITQGAIKDICSILEKYGIIIVEQYDYGDEFDGVSFITDGGIPVIIINGNRSNDRKRLDIAHELGHILMHLFPNIAIPNFRDKEKEAFKFAAEFLMPEKEIKDSLSKLKLSYLMPLKQYWLTSMASIVHRAKDLGCIDKEWYQYLNVELSRRGYKKSEPGIVYMDRPQLFFEAYDLFKTELDYSDAELAETFNLPIDVLTHFFARKPTLLRLLRN